MTTTIQCRDSSPAAVWRATRVTLALATALLSGILSTQGHSQTFYSERALHTFTGGADGAYPMAGLVRDANGDVYGTATFGGATGWGVVFKLDQSGNETVLHNFHGASDGGRPSGGLIFDTSGNLYGTTAQGGAFGAGTVFRLDKSGHEIVLHMFTGGVDGGSPYATLLRDAAGNIFGTTVSGGAYNKGVVFKVEPTGKEIVLHSFAGYPADGAAPYGSLVEDVAGNMYGTTSRGGPGNCTTGILKVKVGCGTVFKIDPIGKESMLYTFSGGTDGSIPFAGVVLHNGGLYGTTFIGGTYGNGTVFKLAHSSTGGWTEHVLYSFLGPTDGQLPEAGLIFDASGNIYGATSAGGTFGGECPNEGCGFVFELKPMSSGWKEIPLYGFTGGPDGGTPYAGVISDTTGHLLGTTFYGGDAACQWCGVVFEISLK